jgi:hypothetical protein
MYLLGEFIFSDRQPVILIVLERGYTSLHGLRHCLALLQINSEQAIDWVPQYAIRFKKYYRRPSTTYLKKRDLLWSMQPCPKIRALIRDQMMKFIWIWTNNKGHRETAACLDALLPSWTLQPSPKLGAWWLLGWRHRPVKWYQWLAVAQQIQIYSSNQLKEISRSIRKKRTLCAPVSSAGHWACKSSIQAISCS